jgi:hypothetical protein
VVNAVITEASGAHVKQIWAGRDAGRTRQGLANGPHTPAAILRANKGVVNFQSTLGRLYPPSPAPELRGPGDVHEDASTVVHRLAGSSTVEDIDS